MYCVLRDLYCAWVLFYFVGVAEQFPLVLAGISGFVLSTDALLNRKLKFQAFLKRFVAVSLVVWFLGASLQRPLQLLSFSFFASSFLSLDVESFLQIPREPLKYAHSIVLMVGAVGGAIFVPLDWGMPWQKFPMPVSVGLCLGSSLGRILEAILIKKER